MTDATPLVCPRCGGSESIARGRKVFAVLGICIIVFGIAVIFLIPPLGIGSLVLGIIVLALSPFAKNFHQCRKCRKMWRIRV